MSSIRTYLDFNATAPVRPEAVDAVSAAMAAVGNASSVHREGRAARTTLETAREQVARLIGAPAQGVVFTSGGTEANDLAICGIAAGEQAERILVSAIEHPSVLQTCHASGLAVREIAVTGEGTLNLDDLAAALGESEDRALVSVMLANNETGALQPIDRVVELARDHGALVHTDAVQAAGKIGVDFAQLGVDALTLSSHKIGGPQGAGAVIVREGLKLTARLRGGGQELRRRAGTENVAAIAGFGAAAQAAHEAISRRGEIATLRGDLEGRISDRIPDAGIIAGAADRLPNTSCVAVPGVTAEYLVIALDLEGFAVSSGSACSSGKVERSHVLEAMGLDDETAECAIRISIGQDTSAAELKRFVSALATCCERKRTDVAEAAA